jgi:hypothetical protein
MEKKELRGIEEHNTDLARAPREPSSHNPTAHRPLRPHRAHRPLRPPALLVEGECVVEVESGW